jgi:EAL domain-containing protein (putative c-di-GMP-specific phosphodiesterase class I)
LEIEITEGVLMQEEARALQRLRALRDLGVHLAIDDFGTGYSSLSYLRTLPVTCLKIDQSFVRHLTENDEDARLNRVIIGMAHDFGLEVVAEGIETAAHADFLRVEGCDLGQGYFYARPLDVAGFTSLLTNPPRWLGREEDLLSASTREASILPFSYRN